MQNKNHLVGISDNADTVGSCPFWKLKESINKRVNLSDLANVLTLQCFELCQEKLQWVKNDVAILEFNKQFPICFFVWQC